MRALPTVILSSTREELLAQIDSVHFELIEFYRQVPADLMLTSADPDGWSVMKNMRHIISTNRYMAAYIGMPAFLLRFFGRPPRELPGLADMRVTNRPHVLDHGCYHAGRLCSEHRRERALAGIARSAEILKEAVRRRTEEELDRFRGPFGGMSLRLFVHFVLKHNVYHSGVVRARLKEEAELTATLGLDAARGLPH